MFYYSISLQGPARHLKYSKKNLKNVKSYISYKYFSPYYIYIPSCQHTQIEKIKFYDLRINFYFNILFFI